MTFLNNLLSEKLIDSIGWTLFHSLWQGIIITLVFAIIMIIIRKYSSRTKYIIGVMTLFFVFLVSFITFYKYYSSGNNIVIKSENLRVVNHNISELDAGIPSDIKQKTIDNNMFFTGITKFFNNYFNKNLPLLVSLWLGGILFLILRSIGSFLYTQRFRHKMVSEPSQFWKKKILDIKKKFNYEKKIVFLSSTLIKVPVVIGFFKPVILFPASLLSGMPVQQIEAILAHEIAHIIRKDYIINILQTLIDTIYFYHPGIRWISSIIRFERENSCDDMAIELTGDSKGFAEALNDIQSLASSTPSAAMAIIGKEKKLLNRIKRIINRDKKISGFSEGFFAASLLGICIILLIFSSNISAGISNKELKTENNKTINKTMPRTRIIHINKDKKLVLDGVLTNNNDYYKKFKLKNFKTKKVVWQLKKRKLNNWGPIFRFKEVIKLKKGDYKIDLYDSDNSYAIIFKEKDDKILQISTIKTNKDSLADKMIDLFIEDESGREISDKLLKEDQKYLIEQELAVKRGQEEKLKEYYKNKNTKKWYYFKEKGDKTGYYLKEKDYKTMQESSKKKFEQIIREEREFRSQAEKKAQEKLEYESQKRINAEKKVQKKYFQQLKEKQIAEETALRKEKEEQEVRIERELENQKAEVEEREIEYEKQKMEIEKETAIKEQRIRGLEKTIGKELIKDYLIKKDQEFNFELSTKKGLILNGKKLNNKYYKKYKKIYEKEIGKKLTGKHKLVFNIEYN